MRSLCMITSCCGGMLALNDGAEVQAEQIAAHWAGLGKSLLELAAERAAAVASKADTDAQK
jgi:hypothetical protein